MLAVHIIKVSCPDEILVSLHLPSNWLYLYIFGPFTTGRAIESKHGSDHGANAHTDYGMLTLLSTDGTPGLQVCAHNSSALVSFVILANHTTMHTSTLYVCVVGIYIYILAMFLLYYECTDMQGQGW